MDAADRDRRDGGGHDRITFRPRTCSSSRLFPGGAPAPALASPRAPVSHGPHGRCTMGRERKRSGGVRARGRPVRVSVRKVVAAAFAAGWVCGAGAGVVPRVRFSSETARAVRATDSKLVLSKRLSTAHGSGELADGFPRQEGNRQARHALFTFWSRTAPRLRLVGESVPSLCPSPQ